MDLTSRFMQALAALERDWDVEQMVELFSDHCDVSNVVSPNVFFGRQGARDYWTIYRAWFGEVESSFHTVIPGNRRTAIEWSSRGTSATGQSIRYEGVTILEFEGARICRFRAYFNPDCLLRRAKPALPVGDIYLNAFSS